jgi:hypothetical protein
MTSVWAEKTEEELLSRTSEPNQRATLVGVVVNSDAVALGSSKGRSADTIMFSLVNFGKGLMQKVDILIVV